MIRPMVPLIVVAALIGPAAPAMAQGAFPAPLPGQSSGVIQNDPAFPPVNGAPSGSFPSGGAAPIPGGAGGFGPPPGASPQAGGFGPPPGAGPGGPSEACMKNFIPLREDAEKKGKLIKAASDRHAGPDEACKLISNFGAAELKMIRYVETNSSKCGIPPQIADQLKAGHKNTEALQTKVCNVAQQMQNRGPAGPSLSEVLGSATAVPEATATKKGGSTFDTLNGNVLAR